MAIAIFCHRRYRMSWGRIDDSLHSHPKATKAGVEAMGLWVLAVSWACAYSPTGEVSMTQLVKLAGEKRTAERCAKKLVAAGLLESTDVKDSFVIHDFEEWNPDVVEFKRRRAELSEKRRQAGKRGAESRWQTDSKSNGKHDGNGVASDGPTRARALGLGLGESSSQDQNNLPDGSTGESRTMNMTADGAMGQAVLAWCDGVHLVTGSPCGPPMGIALSHWIHAKNRHCPSGSDPVEWARAMGEAFAKTRPPGIDGFKFESWLNAGCPGPRKTSKAEPEPPPYHAEAKPPSRPDDEPVATGEQAAAYVSDMNTKLRALRITKTPPTDVEAKAK
jgi:hypothetical protein